MMVRSRWRRATAAILLAALGSGCRAIDVTDNRPIFDDWGIAGYARIKGTVSHADGTRYGAVSVTYMCGDPEPSWFGNVATTTAQGEFDFVVDAPVAGTLPASGAFVCEVRGPGYPVVAHARASVPFSQSPETRPTTTFTLLDGAP